MPKTKVHQYTVYALLDPRTVPNPVCYVGCTKHTPRWRFAKHIEEALYTDNDQPKVEWIRDVIRDGLQPMLLELETIPDGGNWSAREAFWIARYASPDLTNVSSGGAGSPGVQRTEKQKAQISKAHLGRTRPPETGERISAARMGHAVSDETRRKISATKTGNVITTPEIRAKIRSALTGKPKSEQGRANMKAAHNTPEMREKKRQVTQSLVWVTDGVSNSRVLFTDALPEGWRLGRTVSEKHKQAYQARRKAQPTTN